MTELFDVDLEDREPGSDQQEPTREEYRELAHKFSHELTHRINDSAQKMAVNFMLMYEVPTTPRSLVGYTALVASAAVADAILMGFTDLTEKGTADPEDKPCDDQPERPVESVMHGGQYL